MELSSMHPNPEANQLIGTTEWHAIDWQKSFRLLKNLRSRIFRASQEGNYKKVRSLQKLMLRSYTNRVVSVRRITQLNAGKNTPGVDRIVVRTAKEREKLVEELRQHQPWKAKPARRVYIPKANGKQRPLGIPVIKDRCLQTMVVQALEPEWEAKFEAGSYGFRPGRSCHDAIERIFRYARPDSQRKWIVDADIRGAFDYIDHSFLLERIGRFPAKGLLKQWLEAGYLDANVVYPTDSGTPQGGSCSPLLANIALHGLEQAMGMSYQYGGGRTQTCGLRRVVRYADDFLVFCSTQEDAQQAVLLLRDWLKERGLALSEEKTRIVHLKDGVDFLGFHVRQYPSRNTRTGLKTLIKPGKTSVQKIRDRLRMEWLGLKTQRVEVIVKRLNPIIRGWSNYFRTGVAYETFTKLDRWMFDRQVRYVRRMHPRKNYAWKQAKYWGRLNLDRQDKWVFGDKQTGMALQKFIWTPIQRHILIQHTASPDDPSLRAYWQKRSQRKSAELVPSKQRIARRQNYQCPVCKTSLFTDEALHVHHVKPKQEGGNDTYSNLRLVHVTCHQQVHSKAFAATQMKQGTLSRLSSA